MGKPERWLVDSLERQRIQVNIEFMALEKHCVFMGGING
jgi:hypothetical protein